MLNHRYSVSLHWTLTTEQGAAMQLHQVRVCLEVSVMKPSSDLYHDPLMACTEEALSEHEILTDVKMTQQDSLLPRHKLMLRHRPLPCRCWPALLWRAA
jgi:hypothetical protein